MQSQEIGKLALALTKAQAQMKGALKDQSNPFFKSKYADLSSVWEACREPLTVQGLSILQTVHRDEGQTVLRTSLVHISGEWVRSDIPVIVAPGGKQDMQTLGSALTYARRYGLAAMVGVCPEDDDGEAAVGRKAPPQPQHSVYSQIVDAFKLITDNYENKQALENLVKKYGSGQEISKKTPEQQRKILAEVKEMAEISQDQ
jgi:hypothetical protein